MSQSKKRSSTGHVLLPASNSRGQDVLIPLVPHRDVGSWTFGRGTVFWTIWPAVLLHTVFAAAVTSVSLTTQYYLAVPPVLITVLGVVIGFVISYRASSGYERYWLGRCCWTDVIKTSRTMSRLIWIHVPLRIDKDAPSDDLAHVDKCMQEKRLALDLVEGFAVSLKHHLRGEIGIYYEDLYHLIKPLHNHSHLQHKSRTSHARMIQEVLDTTSSAINEPSPNSSARHVQVLPQDPEIPAINEYGTFRPGSSCSSSDEFESPFLFPSSPKRRSHPRILTELVPFSSFFASLGSLFGIRRRKITEFFLHSDDVAANDRLEIKRRFAGLTGRKFRPILAGGGENLPLDVLRCLSEWVAVLDERGVISGNPLGGMYGSLSAFEDSLSALERILTTPLPFVYSAHIRQCVWLYLFLLPFQLVEQFGWYTIPGVGIAAFFYIGFLAAGEEIEQPFGYDENDLDLDLFCRDIIHADIEVLKRTSCANVHLSDTAVKFNVTASHRRSSIERLSSDD